MLFGIAQTKQLWRKTTEMSPVIFDASRELHRGLGDKQRCCFFFFFFIFFYAKQTHSPLTLRDVQRKVR